MLAFINRGISFWKWTGVDELDYLSNFLWISFASSIHLNNSCVPHFPRAKSLGVVLHTTPRNETLSLLTHLSNISRSAYFSLLNISLPTASSSWSTLVITRLHHGSSLFFLVSPKNESTNYNWPRTPPPSTSSPENHPSVPSHLLSRNCTGSQHKPTFSLKLFSTLKAIHKPPPPSCSHLLHIYTPTRTQTRSASYLWNSFPPHQKHWMFGHF